MDNGDSVSDGNPDLNVAASGPAKEEDRIAGDGGALAVRPVDTGPGIFERAASTLGELVKMPSRELAPVQRTIALREKTAEIEYYTAIGLLFIVGLAILKGFFRGR